MVCLGLGLAWYVAATSAVDAGLDALDAQALAQASAAFETALAVQARGLQGHVHALVEDTRIRSTLATPGIDATTIEDVLSDLQKSTGESLYAVLDTSGVVRAVVGGAALRGVDLSPSALVQQARQGVAASEVWSLQDTAVTLVLAPVHLGEDVRAYVMVGQTIDARMLAATPPMVAALVTGDRVLAGTSSPELLTAAGLPPGSARPVPGTGPPRVARTVTLGAGAASAVATWTIPRHHAATTLGMGAIAWPALAIIGLGATAAAGGALRRA